MSVTAAKGFYAAGVSAGLKSSGARDVALVVNRGPQQGAAGGFTANRIKAAPVLWTEQCLQTGASHADLTHEYAACHSEMVSVARALGGQVLRDVSKDDFLDRLPSLRGTVTDRAVLRTLHFFDDDLRVLDQVAALERADIPAFLDLIVESGRSSWMLLQNVYAPERPEEQSLSLALALTEQILGGRGACRVHGGGFAGTILVFVPEDLTGEYVEKMDEVFGRGATKILHIRSIGACEVLTECPFSGVGR